AATRSGGLPGRFHDLLWRSAASSRSPRQPLTRTAALVAEAPAVYATISEPETGAPLSAPPAWPLARELTALRDKLGQAGRLVRVGRHAPGERLLRQVVGKLARRGDFIHAVKGTLELASCLLGRGRPKSAIGLLEEAGPWLRRLPDLTMPV